MGRRMSLPSHLVDAPSWPYWLPPVGLRTQARPSSPLPRGGLREQPQVSAAHPLERLSDRLPLNRSASYSASRTSNGERKFTVKQPGTEAQRAAEGFLDGFFRQRKVVDAEDPRQR